MNEPKRLGSFIEVTQQINLRYVIYPDRQITLLFDDSTKKLMDVYSWGDKPLSKEIIETTMEFYNVGD